MKIMSLENIMRKSFVTLSPEDDLQKAAQLMRSIKLDVLPVTNKEGQLLGIMAKANIFDAVSAGLHPNTLIKELFRKDDVVTLQQDMSYEDAAKNVRESQAGSAILIDKNGKATGIFTKARWIMAMFQQEELLNSRLRAILDTMHNGLIVIDADGFITAVNAAAEKMLSVRSSGVKGKPVDILFKDLHLDDVLTKGNVFIDIKQTIDRSALLCNVTPIINDSQINGAVIVFQDTTDIDQVASKLESVTKLYKTLDSIMEIAYDGIVVVDAKGTILMVNGAAEKFFRISHKKMIGRPVNKVIENTQVHVVARTGVAQINQLQFIGGIPYVVSSMPIIREGIVIGAVGKILFRHLDQVRDLAKKLEDLDHNRALYQSKTSDNQDGRFGFDRIVTSDPEFLQIKEEAAIVAKRPSNILVTGESGTGKELIAQAIHETSFCSKGRIVKVNCAAIPDNLLESEFFGYVPGAFTGAQKNGRKGKVALADGGTLFLDEIGDMSLNLQSKLLRVLQERSFEPLGSDKTIHVNLRIIAATNQNLERLVSKGLFRSDLYYRLNVIRLIVPPLRKRAGDIQLLFHFFLEKYNRIFGTSIRSVSKTVCEILDAHHWPGNVRELENVVERVVNLARSEKIDVGDLPPYLKEQNKKELSNENLASGPKLLVNSRDDHERDMIIAALENVGGNKAKAARKLGISRSWLYEKMNRIGLQTK
ncbi:MAG: sigma 54-interacting transcriptional regulator [Proteobacteria bacterium]|nr:sigma 54-interacting transcriptional regulator [Pseudomonadota bacterium]MBU1582843.1 sigma 54-interacting transcriptional regulator [Pseudomonadota bacterium]MBU2451842.1 sigma 54-interacting transcriptional regulator [Pseudomonadota bacterium]MBU2628672.1 sigma 54-interacting transcriptional regulator [Pseudomonadota bacterium]